ncbi:MAG: TonB family protein [Bryobacteraceae bacterium]
MDWLSLNNIAREVVAWLADTSLRAVMLALLAFLLVAFFRRSATAQHTAWTLVLAGMLVLPFLHAVVPVAHVHLPRGLTSRPTTIAPVRLNANLSHVPVPISSSRPRTDPVFPPLWPLFVVAAYLAGVMLFGARLWAGVLFTRRALRNTRTIHEELWEYYDLIADANVDLNLEESDSVRVPLITGSQLTRVILPADWREWPREKLKAVLAHELAHARRRDPLIAMVVAIDKCLFWFHPLAWWLERRLPVLAEHAADDAALAVSFDTQAYARLLLDSAGRLDSGGNRLLWHAAAMSGPVVAERIRRVLDIRTMERLKPLGKIGRAMLLFAGAMLIWISTAVDVPRLVAQTNGPATGKQFAWQITAEQAAALEQELAANPEDEKTRETLIQYYMFNRMMDRRIPLILWLIDHHPESDLAGFAALIFPAVDGPNVYQDARNRWLTQVNLHPNDARVLLNAAGTLGYPNMQERIDLVQRARKLDPARATEPLARLYSAILLSGNEPGLAAQIRNELQSSTDIALLGSVARHVVEGGVINLSASDRYALAAELVTHAEALEPQNQEWSDLMEGVKAITATVPSVTGQANAPIQPNSVQAIRVGGVVAAANLQQSSPPIYPPLAKAAGVQGTVKLQIRIGADGHVKDITLISGHPLLTTAAVDAAEHYVYKPTLLNGQPTEVLTTVDIVFQLPTP